MIYRMAAKADIEKISELKLKMFQEVDMAHLLVDNFLEEVIDSYKGLYSAGKAQHFIIEEEQEIVACAGAFIKDDIPYYFYKERIYGFIGDVYVEPLFRQRGYARTLTNALLQWFSDKEIKTIRLLASHNARHLYESLGFKETSEMVLHM